MSEDESEEDRCLHCEGTGWVEATQVCPPNDGPCLHCEAGRKALEDLKPVCLDCIVKDTVLREMASRVAAQAEVLSRRAEKEGSVEKTMHEFTVALPGVTLDPRAYARVDDFLAGRGDATLAQQNGRLEVLFARQDDSAAHAHASARLDLAEALRRLMVTEAMGEGGEGMEAGG